MLKFSVHDKNWAEDTYPRLEKIHFQVYDSFSNAPIFEQISLQSRKEESIPILFG